MIRLIASHFIQFQILQYFSEKFGQNCYNEFFAKKYRYKKFVENYVFDTHIFNICWHLTWFLFNKVIINLSEKFCFSQMSHLEMNCINHNWGFCMNCVINESHLREGRIGSKYSTRVRKMTITEFIWNLITHANPSYL